MKKAEYVGGDVWTPVGKCYLCEGEDEIRLVMSMSGMGPYVICVTCIHTHARFERFERKSRWRRLISKISGGP